VTTAPAWEIPVRCERCGRVRTGGAWQDHPGLLPREVLGACATCDVERRARAHRDGYAVAEARTAERARGLEPREGDAFAGFREGGKRVNDKALAVVDAQPVGALATMDYAPAAVLGEAQKAAAALKDVIARKPKPVIMNGEQYLEFEDWQTVGRFYGVTAGLEGEPEFVDLGGVQGFKATAVALRGGQVISRATAYCMRDEEKWGARPKYEWQGGQRTQVGSEPVPTYQLASMAQTRACAKALRNVLSWVAVLAGYKPTPAEEMDGVTSGKGAGGPAQAGGPASDRVPCPKCKKPWRPSKFPKPGASHYCMDCKHGYVPLPAAGPEAPWTGDEPEPGSEG
jgi:hypothetical protein